LELRNLGIALVEVTLPAGGPESSLDLLARAQNGDAEALDGLIARYLPRLQRWASGRLPDWARDLAETQDLVQETVVQAFKHIDRFEVRGEGALQAYLRQALMNRIRSEIRRVARRPATSELDSKAEDASPSPLERAVGAQAVDRYERALGELRPEEREAIVGRIELGLSYPELAEALGKPTPNAARMAFERALLRLAKQMRRTSRQDT
jgi:RNA polymerase sigma-70 factor, ECF subfamily